jgi:hypothetical protein
MVFGKYVHIVDNIQQGVLRMWKLKSLFSGSKKYGRGSRRVFPGCN